VIERPLPNSYWVLGGRFLAGEYPLPRGGETDRSNLDKLLAAGVDCFIDLTEPDETQPYFRLLPADVEYIRKPIPDHDVPGRNAHMREIQDEIANALLAGRRIYLHCRAGIGRTATAVGCFLIEQGRDGDESLGELNRLWRQSERSNSWPEVPQTPEQADYIRHWVQHRRKVAAVTGYFTETESALGVVGSMRERYQGAMLGLAIGDALAAATQFRRPGSFTPVGDMLGGGPFDLPRGAWSDDTAMALCLADSLAATDRFDPKDQVERYQQWQSDGYLSATGLCLGITAATAKALAAARWRRLVYAGSHDPAQLDPEPLSRVAPAVLHAFDNSGLAIEQAINAARATSQAPIVLDACRLLGAMLVAALRGEPRERVVTPSPALLGSKTMKPEVAAIVAAAPEPPGTPDKRGHGADVVAALRIARWALASTTSFRAGALAAVNVGGHSDVIGAVYGQLAGAHYGVNAIPRNWRAALAHAGLIETLADRLLASALVRMGDGVVAG
jgi:ADP-ribosylglycohydrolase